MFDRIAPVYDVMNRAMTAGLDGRWRRLAARRGRVAGRPGARCLLWHRRPRDRGRAPRREGGRRSTSPSKCSSARGASRERSNGFRGTHSRCPFGDGDFDVVTVGFGVRNLDDLEGGLRELHRVLRPGGRVAVLEITRPRGLLRPFFRLWFDVLVPFAGKVLPGGKAYTYLPASVRRFPGPGDLARALRVRRLRGRALPAARRRQRRPAHGGAAA